MAVLNNLVIDRVIDLAQYDRTTGEMQVMLPEVTDFQISITTNEDEITDATGSPIAIIESAKQAEFSGNASFINIPLLAVQSAADVESSNITMPMLETKTIASDGTITLSQTPVGETGAEIGHIYVRNTDGTQGESIAQDTSAGEGKFSVSGKVVTFAQSLAGTQVYVPYNYAATSGVHIVNDSEHFTTSSRIVVRVLCRNVCNDNDFTILTIVSDNAKLNSAFDLTLSRGEQHPFTYRVLPSYCGAEGKTLYEIFELDSNDYVG